MQITVDGKSFSVPDAVAAEVHFSLDSGPIGSGGFRSGFWTFRFRGETFTVEQSVPMKATQHQQHVFVLSACIRELARLGKISDATPPDPDPFTFGLEDELAEKVGAILAAEFGMRRDSEYRDRWQTASGSYTNKGVARRAFHLISEAIRESRS